MVTLLINDTPLVHSADHRIDEPVPNYTQLIKLSRVENRILFGMITGHIALNKFVSGISPMCGCCSQQDKTGQFSAISVGNGEGYFKLCGQNEGSFLD